MIYKVIYGDDLHVGNLLGLQHDLFYLTFNPQSPVRAAFKVGTLQEVTAYCQQVLGKGKGRFVKDDQAAAADPAAPRRRDLVQLGRIIQALL
jgi:hypothetical protein